MPELKTYEQILKEFEISMKSYLDSIILDSIIPKYISEEYLDLFVNYNNCNYYLDIGIEVDPFLPTDTKEMCAMKVNKAIQSNCAHSWKTYTGFTEKYEYCEKCDHKRS